MKDKRRILLILGIIVVVVLVVIASWPLYFSKTWDGGKWDDAKKLGFRIIKRIEYKNQTHFFYTKMTKSNFNDNHTIDPGEYSLNDIFYRKFNNGELSEESFVTSPSDDADGLFLGASVYNGRLYVFVKNSQFVNGTGYYYNQSSWIFNNTMMEFDGSQWKSTSLDWARMAYVQTLVFKDELWTVTKNLTHIIYRTYNGKGWSTNQSIEIADITQGDPNFTSPNSNYFYVLQGRLWHIYRTAWSAEVFLHSYDGANWSDLIRIPAAVSRTDFYDVLEYKGRLVITTRELDPDWSRSFIRLVELKDGAIKDQRVSTDPDENTGARNCIYNGDLYIVWSNRETGDYGKLLRGRIQVRGYDGSSLSSVYTIEGPTDGHDDEVEHVFSSDGKLWVIWGSEDSYYIRGYSEGYF